MTAVLTAPNVRDAESAAAPPVLRVRAAVRRHRNGRGAGPVDLDVHAGETFALMGRNGSGKTTLLRMLATVTRPQSGAIEWFGGGAAGARRRLGLALDSALEDPGLSGRQAAHFWCSQWVRDRDRAATLTGAALAALGLEHVADEPVGDYSFGMRRRLALAAALAHRPELALLDEPTAGLDPEGSQRLGALLADRARAGATTVVASNDAAFVEAVAARVAFLEGGRALRTAATAELLALVAGERTCELRVRGAVDVGALRGLPGVLAVSAAADRVTVRFREAGTLTALVAVADAPGGRLVGMEVRRPGLADCFQALTGRPLVEDSDDG